MTREQIGQLLGYKNPKKAIKDIHIRNRERLDLFSKQVELPKPFNGAQNEPPFRNSPIITVYNFKGLLEICRYSQQEITNNVIDVLWDIADEIRRTGMFVTDAKIKQLEQSVTELKKQLDDTHALTVLGQVVLAQKGAISFQSAAQFLAQHGIDIGQNRLFKRCRDKKLLCSRKGKQWNKPTQKAIDAGLFNVELSGGFYSITLITPRGLQVLADELFNENYPLLIVLQH